jgi:hypothetical protein
MAISIRRAAKELGVKHPALLKAIKVGSLKREPDGSLNMANVRKSEWWRNHQERPKRTATIAQTIPVKPAAEPISPDEKKTREKIVRLAKAFQITGDVEATLAIDKIQLEKLLLMERREQLRLENERIAGSLVKKEDVLNAWQKISAQVKNRMLLLPGSISSRLVGKNDPREIEIELDREVREILMSISEMKLHAA